MITKLRAFPGFLWANLVGLVSTALTEFESLVIVIIGVLLGLALGPAVGAAIALALWLVLKQVSSFVGASVQVKRTQAEQINFLAQVIRDNPYFQEKVQDKAA